MHAGRWVIVITSFTLLAACASQSQQPSPRDQQASPANMQTLSTGQLLDENSPLVAGQELPDLSDIDILELTPGMIKFLDRNVYNVDNRYTRLRQLLYAVVGDGQFDLVYDDKTRTAVETFRDQRGNCLSFTNMFIAMARHLDLDASYQEVRIPPDWSRSGHAFLLSKHINVYIDMEIDDPRVVDFNMAEFDIDYDRWIISDERARAHYFSNIGVEHMLAGDTVLAFANYRESLLQERNFSPAWVNLGILYRREGYPEYAEAAFLRAMEIDRLNLVAISNLASLYAEQGNTELAAKYFSQVDSHRMRNPYYRYQLAQEDFVNGDYQSAISHLKYAIRQRESDDSFYMLLSLSYLMSGDREAARRWMSKAEEVAELDADKRKYSSKYELLMGQRKVNGN